MVQWLIRHCFTNLELESQKNRLLLFMLVPLFLFAELDITISVPFTHPANQQFILYYLILFGCSFILIFFPAAEKAYKYIVISGMLIFSMYELWLFQDYPIIYQIMYINLGLALIYLNGYLIMYTGIATAVLTAVGFVFWSGLLRSKSKRVTTPVSAYLIEHPRGHVLIDTGWHEDIRKYPKRHIGFPNSLAFRGSLPEGAAIHEQLAERGLNPCNLEYVVLTHLHADHVSGLPHVCDAKKIITTHSEWIAGN